MSALDLDALERLARACVAANEKVDAAPNAYTRWDAEEERRAPHEDLGLHGAEVLALITRLRAAEARTAWQPIETAPPLEEGALGPWVQVWGVRFGRRKPDVHLARLDGIGWGDRDGNGVRPLLWAPAMDAPLPAAPEAP